MTKQLHPCIWFDGQAKAAADLYCSVFDNSTVTVDTPMVVTFELNGQKFMGLNGGPKYKANPSISFFVVCETETEVDKAWKKLSEGGSTFMPLGTYDWSQKYGWVQDRYGVNWQLSFGKMKDVGQKFTPTLMFVGDQCGNAEKAINHYTSIFEDSSTVGILKYAAGEEDKEGLVKHAQFHLNKYVMMAMDSSAKHSFTFSEGVSFVVECDTQNEIDYYWEKLTEGGKESMCGWLRDKYGVSWQIVPAILGKLMSDPSRSQRVIQAFLQMKKFDMEKLIQA